MRLSHIVEQVYCKPWAIRPAHWAAIHSIVQSKLADNLPPPAPSDTSAEDETDFFGEPLPQPYIDDGVAVVPVCGYIGRRLSLIERQCGGLDLLDLSAWVKSAALNPAARAILLECDTPGGMVTGTPEVAAEILAADAVKPVYAFTAGMACSAGYWLASQARGFLAAPSADVGSIGVYCAMLDESRAYELAGLRVELFKAGRLKGAGVPGTSLSEEQRANLQAEVDAIFAWFKADVLARRPMVEDETMQGQSFLGTAAAERGLVDALVPSLPEALAWVRSQL